VIVDFHTHVFPPEIAAGRQRHLDEDATFRTLYENPQAILATAEDLSHSMDEAGIDVSVALGFAWRDARTCREHNDYLMEVAARSGGRIVAFPTLPLGAGVEAIEQEMRRCVAAGARGFGELRPGNLDFELDSAEGARLASVAEELGCAVLFHVSEPVGHAYPGKEGLDMAEFYRFVTANPGVKTIGAHWGGGLAFYASMPEVKRVFEANVSVDTAASSLLYDDGMYERGAGLVGAEHVLFGSDYPLLSQKRSRRRIEESGLEAGPKQLILGGNAAGLLGLS
jgi:predicted TIM-barrel fold metal-dependent hydrolase